MGICLTSNLLVSQSANQRTALRIAHRLPIRGDDELPTLVSPVSLFPMDEIGLVTANLSLPPFLKLRKINHSAGSCVSERIFSYFSPLQISE